MIRRWLAAIWLPPVLALTLMTLAAPARAGGQVFLMRGFADVSTGLDDLAQKLRHRGIAATVRSYSDEEGLAANAIRLHRSGRGPIIIIGHSLGADAAIHMAQTLRSAKVPVALIVAFGPATSLSIPANVHEVINYYQSSGIVNATYSPGPGSHGTLRNIDLDNAPNVNHFNIEKVGRLHARIIARILGLDSAHASAAAHEPAPGAKAHAAEAP
jgi:pimeloyl-ACP methyl ester carboxylesterase